MDGFTVHELAADVTVRITREMEPLPAALDAKVETLWRRAALRVEAGGAGRLFNGRVFSASVIARTEILGGFTEYRRLVAQMEDPSLFPALGIRSLAVCGVLRCADGVVIGRRPAASIYQPGMWQLSPAGSVDAGAANPDGRIDLTRQLLTELREELGLSADTVGPPTPLCVVEHPGSHVSDLGLALTSPLSGAEVLATHKALGNTEYDPLRIVPLSDLPNFLAEAGALVVPPAFEFLRRAGLLPR